MKISNLLKLLVLVALALFIFVACGREDGEENEYEAIFDENAPVAVVDGVNIYPADIYPHLRQAEHMFGIEFLMMHNTSTIDFEAELEYGLTFGDAIRQEAVRAAAFEMMLENYAISLGMEVSAAMRAEIEEEVDIILAMLGEQYSAALASQGFASRYELEEAFASQYLIESMLEYVINNPLEFAQFEHHVPEDAAAEGMTQAESILQRLHDGEDFDELMFAYSQDPGLEFSPEGYTFIGGIGMMVSEFERTTRELEIGEISGIVITDLGVGRGFGAHIIQRIEPSMEEIDDMYEEGDEVLASKHILILLPSRPVALEERMIQAIIRGAYHWVLDADIEFLPNLDTAPLQQPNLF